MIFRGTFEHSLDAKNRLTVPARYRTHLAGDLVLALAPSAETDGAPCLELWKADDHAEFAASALAGLNPISPTAKRLRAMFYTNAWDCELDAAHRLVIPPIAREFARIERDVVINGLGQCVQIWSRAAFSAYNVSVLDGYAEIAQSFDHTA